MRYKCKDRQDILLGLKYLCFGTVGIVHVTFEVIIKFHSHPWQGEQAETNIVHLNIYIQHPLHLDAHYQIKLLLIVI